MSRKPDPIDVSGLSPEALEFLERKAEVLLDTMKRRRKLDFYFPDKTIPVELVPFNTGGHPMYSRDQYPKQLQFFEAGARERERGFMAANRVGKSEAGAYEMALHLTGQYPDWWVGRRFDMPVSALCAGLSATETRDVPQNKLIGPPADKTAWGTGMIPGDTIMEFKTAQGVPNGVDMVVVKHVSGRNSVLQFRSCEQGAGVFQGTERDVIWLDEEPPVDVYTECVLRTTTTNGIIMVTFTPLQGLSETALKFLPHLAPEVDDELEWADDND